MGIEIRSDRPELRDWLGGLNHHATWQAVSAEREIIPARDLQSTGCGALADLESNYRLARLLVILRVILRSGGAENSAIKSMR